MENGKPDKDIGENVIKTDVQKKYDEFINVRKNRICVIKIVDTKKFDHIIKKKVKNGFNVNK
jgi:hypothetical protein